jgi:hypothetical protein
MQYMSQPGSPCLQLTGAEGRVSYVASSTRNGWGLMGFEGQVPRGHGAAHDTCTAWVSAGFERLREPAKL